MLNADTLTLKDLSCTRGERVLFTGLNSTLTSGQCLHVVGANGCGKSSLLRIISGLNTPDDGQILWNDIASKSQKGFLNNSAFIGHKDALKNELSAIENLRIYQNINNINKKGSRKDKENQLDDCLNQMQILDSADLLCQQLSFGQRRRLAFARLLLRPYKLWILDEPFTGIDTQGRDIIEQHCMSHLSNGGAIILTHHQSLKASVFSQHLIELQLDQYSSTRGS